MVTRSGLWDWTTFLLCWTANLALDFNEPLSQVLIAGGAWMFLFARALAWESRSGAHRDA